MNLSAKNKRQGGFSIVENLVAMMVLSITAFGFIGTSVFSLSMKKAGLERSAAIRAANTAINQIYSARGDKAAIAAEIANFPKTITESETHRNYVVNISALQDAMGNVVTANTLPDHGVLVATLTVPYSDAIGTAAATSANKTAITSFSIEF